MLPWTVSDHLNHQQRMPSMLMMSLALKLRLTSLP